MISLKSYIIIFITTLFTYLALLSFIDVTPVVFLFFVVSTIAHIFAIETKPKKLVNQPQVHFYRTSRINTRAYILVSGASFSAFLFYILTTYTTLPFALITFFLWADTIILSFVALKTTVDKLYRNMIIDFIQNSNKTNLDSAVVKNFVSSLTSKKTIDKTDVDNAIKMYTQGLDQKQKKELINLYIEYTSANSRGQEAELTSQEIDAINQ